MIGIGRLGRGRLDPAFERRPPPRHRSTTTHRNSPWVAAKGCFIQLVPLPSQRKELLCPL